MKRKMIAATVAVFFIVGAVAGCSNSSGSRRDKDDEEEEEEEDESVLDVEDYFSCSFDGYDGYGSIVFDVDYASMIDDFEALESMTEGRLAQKITPVYDGEGTLSNGDIVTVSWVLDVDSIDDLEIEADDIEVTVSGLEEIPEFDPFDYLEVTFEGQDPNGYANLQTLEGSPIDGINYTASSTSYLSNGDVITVTASIDEQTCLDNGYILVTNEKEYTVEGLTEYVTSMDQLTDEVISEMQDEALDEYMAAITSWENVEELESTEFVGYYFLSAKDSDTWYDHNYVYIIINAEADNPCEYVDYYYWVRFSNVTVDADGNCSVDLNYTTLPYGSCWFGDCSGAAFTTEEVDGQYYWYVGYRELDDLYSNDIQPNLADYNVYDNIEED